MKTQIDHETATFPDYLANVRGVLSAAFGLAVNRQDEAKAQACFRDGWSPADCAKAIARGGGPKFG